MKITIEYDVKTNVYSATGYHTTEDGTKLCVKTAIENPYETTIEDLYSNLYNELSEIFLNIKSPLM